MASVSCMAAPVTAPMARRAQVAPSLRCSIIARAHVFTAATVRQQQRATAMRAVGEREEAIEEAVVEEEQQDFVQEWQNELESFQARRWGGAAAVRKHGAVAAAFTQLDYCRKTNMLSASKCRSVWCRSVV